MPSKGIICFSYIAVPGISIEFSVPEVSVTKHEERTYTRDHLEVETKNLGAFKFTGRFSFTVRRDGRDLANQWVDVNALTGSLENGTMKDMEQTPSIFAEDVVIVYGFYDAGPGAAGLPKQHECYVTVTQNYSDWMRDVAPPGSEKADKPFNRMVLPSPHDIGMNSMQNAQAMLQRAGSETIKSTIGTLPHAFSILNKVADSAVKGIAPDIIRGLSITQKDSLESILKLGARYFEFRPAKCLRRLQEFSPLEDTWYFQHGGIPGMLYLQFLHDVVQFLSDHADEIVVVQNRWDGVPEDCPRPSDDDLRGILEEALKDRDIQVGNLEDMLHKSIKELREERKRLIVTRDVNQVSNYDDAANATLNGDTIVTALDHMGENSPKGHPIVLLQCQATATNIRDVIVYSVLSSDASTSPILATKPICDAKILPLLKGNLGGKLAESEGVVVVLNDFFDGATSDCAIELCKNRLG
ncbi:PLC-like phosphodiesterase [Delitschia confertaspora ATCC 74209]|uniref:PLC-like phosphodiesterase n=1 Tax=Delitschia confertaspora ATCC 74209 TaxID=1513339 RepID=A0A9P4JHW5_9PLEO|nr:PLC-like phosphodiesterase [Delitschia confertaspora ATCC 74209]